MTRFYLIRHGETAWNVSGRWQGHLDAPLNEIGRAQAERLAARLRDEPLRFDAIYSSDLQRAWHTAQTIGNALGMEPQPMVELREIDLGTWSGLTRAEIAARDGATLARLDAGEDVPRGGAERMLDLYQRVVRALERTAAAHPNQSVAMVTHGGTVRAALAHALRGQGEPNWKTGFNHIGNTSITLIIHSPSGWDVGVVNDMAHLAGSPQARDLMSAPPDDAQQV